MSSRVLATAWALPADFDILSHYVDNLDVCLRAFSQDSIWKMQPVEFANARRESAHRELPLRPFHSFIRSPNVPNKIRHINKKKKKKKNKNELQHFSCSYTCLGVGQPSTLEDCNVTVAAQTQLPFHCCCAFFLFYIMCLK